ncbi:MAG: transposase DNA-binding-containing protein [Salinisphaera sp.]|jgi:hypothetical protein|nr:transposase DNA-binding-containing protein [Salinisphaera sp.]
MVIDCGHGRREGDRAEQLFSACDLGDSPRTRRLVDVGAGLARQMGASMARCYEGETAALLGSYRLMGDDEVSPDAIQECNFSHVAQQAQSGWPSKIRAV